MCSSDPRHREKRAIIQRGTECSFAIYLDAFHGDRWLKVRRREPERWQNSFRSHLQEENAVVAGLEDFHLTGSISGRSKLRLNHSNGSGGDHCNFSVQLRGHGISGIARL